MLSEERAEIFQARWLPLQISLRSAFLNRPLDTSIMAFSTMILPFVALALSTVNAAPAAQNARCSDGTVVPNSICCDFIPVRIGSDI